MHEKLKRAHTGKIYFYKVNFEKRFIKKLLILENTEKIKYFGEYSKNNKKSNIYSISLSLEHVPQELNAQQIS